VARAVTAVPGLRSSKPRVLAQGTFASYFATGIRTRYILSTVGEVGGFAARASCLSRPRAGYSPNKKRSRVGRGFAPEPDLWVENCLRPGRIHWTLCVRARDPYEVCARAAVSMNYDVVTSANPARVVRIALRLAFLAERRSGAGWINMEVEAT